MDNYINLDREISNIYTAITNIHAISIFYLNIFSAYIITDKSTKYYYLL